MDLSKKTDINELKALAYDQLSLLEVTQANIRALNQRIVELSTYKDEQPPENE